MHVRKLIRVLRGLCRRTFVRSLLLMAHVSESVAQLVEAADLEFSPPISAKAVERMACGCNVDPARFGLGGDRCRALQASDIAGAEAGAECSRQGMPLSRLRPTGDLDLGPSPGALD